MKEEQESMLDIYGQWIPVKYIFNSEKKDKKYYEKLRREEGRKNGISKKSKIPTNYVLPVKIEHRNGVTAMNYYYEDKKTLYKAYNQLKHIKGIIKPLYPVIYE